MVESELILEVEGLSKSFVLNHKGRSARHEALKDISFNLYRGQVLGLIGPNGSGKSTLLRILSGMMKPESGVARIFGRTASVLEIGSGFHQDLSGIENIGMVAALLGIRGSGTNQFMSAVKEFSGLEDYLEEPLKTYSSGMFLRLAFAVAIHADAELLLLDEIVGVGDEEFSRKTVRKLKELCRSGKSVILASHASGTLHQLCHLALLLNKGKQIMFGDAAEVLSGYAGQVLEKEKKIIAGESDAQEVPEEKRVYQADDSSSNSILQLKRAWVEPGSGLITMDTSVNLGFEFEFNQDTEITLSVQLNYQLNYPAICLSPDYSLKSPNKIYLKGIYMYSVNIPGNLLNKGSFSVSIFAVNRSNHTILAAEHILYFELGLGKRAQEVGYGGLFPGPMFSQLSWTVNFIPS